MSGLTCDLSGKMCLWWDKNQENQKNYLQPCNPHCGLLPIHVFLFSNRNGGVKGLITRKGGGGRKTKQHLRLEVGNGHNKTNKGSRESLSERTFWMSSNPIDFTSPTMSFLDWIYPYPINGLTWRILYYSKYLVNFSENIRVCRKILYPVLRSFLLSST